MTQRELFLETVRSDKAPCYLADQYAPLGVLMRDPLFLFTRGDRYRGMAPLKDAWGVEFIWPEDQLAGMPHVTAENKVVPDVTRWRETVVPPDLLGSCSDPALWEAAAAEFARIDRREQLATAFMPSGVFEQLQYLMGFEDTLIYFLTEPEAMLELCDFLGEYRLQYAKLLVEHLKPDAVLSHDDWGTKESLFISPEVWRTFLKPQYKKLYGYLRQAGVLAIHHADCYLEPIVEDMAEIGIDVWQGVLPQNNIPAIQQRLGGRMTLMGGIDAAVVDRADSSEAEIRGEARRACQRYGPGGHYIPSMTYGGPSYFYPHVKSIISDEISRYNLERQRKPNTAQKMKGAK